MLSFLEVYWIYFVLGIIIIYAIYLTVTKQWGELREYAYALMLQAERLFAEEDSQEKFETVFSELYENYMPTWLKIFVSEDYLKEILQGWYDKAKDFLDDGTINDSITESAN